MGVAVMVLVIKGVCAHLSLASRCVPLFGFDPAYLPLKQQVCVACLQYGLAPSSFFLRDALLYGFCVSPPHPPPSLPARARLCLFFCVCRS